MVWFCGYFHSKTPWLEIMTRCGRTREVFDLITEYVVMGTHVSHKSHEIWFDTHDDVIKWKHFPHHRPFVNSPHKGQWGGALMFSLTCVWINGWANNREAGDLRHHRVQYDVTTMIPMCFKDFIIFVLLFYQIHLQQFTYTEPVAGVFDKMT